MTHDGIEVTQYLPASMGFALESIYGAALMPTSFGFITAEEAARRRAEREAWERAHPWRHRAQRTRRAVRTCVEALRRALGERIGGSTLHEDCGDYS